MSATQELTHAREGLMGHAEVAGLASIALRAARPDRAVDDLTSPTTAPQDDARSLQSQ
jgi:hypothetical protein